MLQWGLAYRSRKGRKPGSVRQRVVAPTVSLQESDDLTEGTTMRTILLGIVALVASLVCLPAREAAAVVTVYFNPDQVATVVEIGTTWDTITCEGYMFTYTRDKLFTGGGSEPIGRPVRIPWPEGIEAQYVTAGPNPGDAEIVVQRVDGGLFDLTSFTAMLLANAGAGRAIEIVPMLNGEEPLNDPLYFDVSGNYGTEFSYDTSPNPYGSTAELVNYDAYKIRLTLDYALTALTLTDPSAPSAVDSERSAAGDLVISPNPAGNRVQIALGGDKSGAATRLSVFSPRGDHVRSLALDVSGRTTWDLCDDGGRPVAAGVYFLRTEAAGRPSGLRRVVVVR